MGNKINHNFRNNKLTKFSGFIIFLFVIITHFQDKKWTDSNSLIMGDVMVYYAYLPAYFIHEDIDFVDPEVYHHGDHLRILYAQNPDGQRYIRSTCGMAMVYAPFFFIGHLAAMVLGEPTDGFSTPYLFSLVIGTLIYLVVGLVFLSKLLLRYFDDRTVSITLLVLYLGTNFLSYLTESMLYPHGFSFTLLVIVLYGSVRWLENASIKWSVIIGLTASLLVLIRPVDVIFVVFLPLIGVISRKQLMERLQFLWHKKGHILLMLGVGLLIMIPQFIYNYHLSGKLIFNVYAHSGERFFFTNPHLLDSLFSYRNGWLVYSPLMIFSLIGIVLLLRKRSDWILYIIPVFLIYYFVLASWWCWWYAGFGNRAYINMYPFLAVPLATTVHYVMKKSFVIRLGFQLVLFAGILVSLFQANQFSRGVIHWGEMTKDAYWSVFLKQNPSELHSTLLRTPNVDDSKKGLSRMYAPKVNVIYENYFSFDYVSNQDSSMAAFVRKGEVHVPGEIEFFGDIPLPISEKINEVYLTAWVKGADEQEMHLTLTNATQSFMKISGEVLKTNGVWKQFHCYAQIPESVLSDTLHFKIWNQARNDLTIDKIRFLGRYRSFELIDE